MTAATEPICKDLQMESPIVITSPGNQPRAITSSVVAFGNNALIFLSNDKQSYLYGRPAVLASTLREWADCIDPKPVGAQL